MNLEPPIDAIRVLGADIVSVQPVRKGSTGLVSSFVRMWWMYTFLFAVVGASPLTRMPALPLRIVQFLQMPSVIL
jgi:hypothetical protein